MKEAARHGKYGSGRGRGRDCSRVLRLRTTDRIGRRIMPKRSPDDGDLQTARLRMVEGSHFAALLSWSPERFTAAIEAGELPAPAFRSRGRQVSAMYWRASTVNEIIRRHRR